MLVVLPGGPRRAMAAMLDSCERSRRLGRCEGNPKKVPSSVPPCCGHPFCCLPVVQEDKRERAVFLSSALSLLVGPDDGGTNV